MIPRKLGGWALARPQLLRVIDACGLLCCGALGENTAARGFSSDVVFVLELGVFVA